MHYDIAAGMDVSTINNLIQQGYKKLYPKLFKATFNVGQMGIKSIIADIEKAPILVTGKAAQVQDLVNDAITRMEFPKNATPDNENMAKLINATAASSVMISLPDMLCTINYEDETQATQVKASMQACVTFQSEGSGTSHVTTLRIINGTISVSENSAIEELLNKTFVPNVLIPYLNDNILKPIQLPSLRYGPIQTSMPTPAAQPPDLVAYAALGTTPPEIPPSATWPSGCFFAGVNTNVLQAVCKTTFPIGPRADFSWDIISGIVGAQIRSPNPIVIQKDGVLSATVSSELIAQLTLKMPWPLADVHFGPHATATITVTLQSLFDDRTLCLRPESIAGFSFNYDWGIPSWIDWLFKPLELGLSAALNAVLGPLIRQALEQIKIPLLILPDFTLNIAGEKFTVNIKDLKAGSGNSLLLFTGNVSIS